MKKDKNSMLDYIQELNNKCTNYQNDYLLLQCQFMEMNKTLFDDNNNELFEEMNDIKVKFNTVKQNLNINNKDYSNVNIEELPEEEKKA